MKGGQDGMNYTFYGDLLGVSSYYKLGTDIAYSKLNLYYNITFKTLETYCQNNQDVQVLMFSDSMFMWGNDAFEALRQLHRVYRKLLAHFLFLRGAMVARKLEIDPRFTLSNFKKTLPKDDTLARAVGLEASHKGARLIIENDLARRLFQDNDQWLTHDGYIGGVSLHPQNEDVLRRICPTPENDTYEFLYLWPPDLLPLEGPEEPGLAHYSIKSDLEETGRMLSKGLQEHYKATIQLLKRCKQRDTFTERRLGREPQTGS